MTDKKKKGYFCNLESELVVYHLVYEEGLNNLRGKANRSEINQI